MHTTRFERMALAKFFVAGWVAFFGIAIEHAQAQPGLLNPVPPPAPPVFNPSTPNALPAQRETPVSPETPSTLPGSQLNTPVDESPPSAAAPSHPRGVSSAKVTSHAAKGHRSRQAIRHHRRSWSHGSHRAAGSVFGPAPDYHPPLDYTGPYCVWRQGWDGYWAPVCF
jgi:hypothetical protein